MKIERVEANNRRKAFVIHTRTRILSLPYAKLRIQPTEEDRIAEVLPDPDYLTELLMPRLTVEARTAVEETGISKRELIRRLNTSASQFYRLLDPA